MIENSVFLLQVMHEGAIARTRAAHARLVQGHDRVAYDDEPGSVTYYRGDKALARYRYETLATFDKETRVFRWGWADRAGVAAKSVDAIYLAGQESQLPSLTSEQIHEVWETDAERLIGLGAHLAGASGVLRCDGGDRATWLALFDPSPARAPRSLRQHAPIQTMPPASMSALGGAPAAAPYSAVRTPAQHRLRHVVGALRDDLRASCMGFREALFVVRIDLRQDKARFVVQLSVVDADGRLEVLDPSMLLMDACARFIRADADERNGRWHRLLVRISSDALGANIDEVRVD